jgi:hypothetical protein
MSKHGGRAMTLRECMEAEEKPQGTRSQQPEPVQIEQRVCPYCHGLFTPKRLLQEFCGRDCRKHYHEDIGTEGVVAGVTRIKRGVSIVMHFANGPAAERAIKLLKGGTVRLVPK